MTNEELAYIAGFLDGDGCIMLQMIYRKDYLLGYQIRASVVFYQKQRNSTLLEWLKQVWKSGYIRNRNDGMCEYTVVGPKPVATLLTALYPYLRLKKQQATVALAVLAKMPDGRLMKPNILYSLAKEVDQFAEFNYSKRRTNTSQQVKEFLVSHNLLDPVETDP